MDLKEKLKEMEELDLIIDRVIFREAKGKNELTFSEVQFKKE